MFSIRYKLTLMLAGIVGVVLLLSFAIILYRDVDITKSQMADRYSALAKVVAANSATDIELVDIDPTGAVESVRILRVEEQVLAAALYKQEDEGQFTEVARVSTERFAGDTLTLPSHIGSRFADDGTLKVVEEVKRNESDVVGKIYLLVSTEQLDAQIRSHLYIGVTVFAVAILLSLALSFVLQRFIAKPILALAQTSQQVSIDHDYSLRAKKRSNDELGVLCDSFNLMLAEVEQKEAALGQSNVDLENTVSQMQATVQQLEEREHELQEANTEREKTLQGIRDAVKQLNTMAAELSTTIAQQNSGAQEQATAVTQTVTTVDELSQTAAQSAKRADHVVETARQVAEVGDRGRKSVDESAAAMAEVKEQVESIAESILQLAERAQAIGEITSSVNDIAEQTNVLALNAAVEASRAGEHGKGFAVVAAEVKALAEQSKKATAQVRQILGEIQQATNSTVMSTEQGTRAVTAASEVVAQAGETIKTLSKTIGESAKAATQISASASQQATGVLQLKDGINNINRVTKENVIAYRQIEQSAQSLRSLSEELERLSSNSRPN